MWRRHCQRYIDPLIRIPPVVLAVTHGTHGIVEYDNLSRFAALVAVAVTVIRTISKTYDLVSEWMAMSGSVPTTRWVLVSARNQATDHVFGLCLELHRSLVTVRLWTAVLYDISLRPLATIELIVVVCHCIVCRTVGMMASPAWQWTCKTGQTKMFESESNWACTHPFYPWKGMERIRQAPVARPEWQSPKPVGALVQWTRTEQVMDNALP